MLAMPVVIADLHARSMVAGSGGHAATYKHCERPSVQQSHWPESPSIWTQADPPAQMLTCPASASGTAASIGPRLTEHMTAPASAGVGAGWLEHAHVKAIRTRVADRTLRFYHHMIAVPAWHAARQPSGRTHRMTSVTCTRLSQCHDSQCHDGLASCTEGEFDGLHRRCDLGYWFHPPGRRVLDEDNQLRSDRGGASSDHGDRRLDGAAHLRRHGRGCA